MMNSYTLRYTIWDPKNPKPTHKKYNYESENDLLAAADEGMCKVYDEHPRMELLFRAIELNNGKEVFEEMTRETASSV